MYKIYNLTNNINITLERSDKMKKIFILYILILVLGFAFVCGYYIYKIPKKESIIEENLISKQNINMYNEVNNILSQEALATNVREEDKVSPNATLILKTNHKECGHTTKDEVDVPAEIVNKNKKEVSELYPQWEVIGFAPDEIVLYREVEGICNEHYVLREKDGFLAIYTKNQNGEEKLKEVTSIPIEYLPQDDIDKIKEGIEATGKEELNSILEDFE